jgi:HlyD family secretion protein
MTKPGGIKTGLDQRERLIGISSVLGLILVVGLFHIVTIDSAVIATGQVVVQGKPRPVQSLEGGLVHKINVREGDVVTAGQVIVRLDPTVAQINMDIIRSRLAELVGRRARLEAEQQKLSEFPPIASIGQLELKDIERYLAGQYEIFYSRRAVLEGQRAQLNEQIQQFEAQSNGFEAQIDATESQVDLISREIGNLETLLTQGLVPESRLLELQRRRASLLGQIAFHRSELARLRNAIRDAELKITQGEREFHASVVSELREVTAGIEENLLEMARVGETLERLDIRAPVSGIVHELEIWTSGGVVPPQKTLMTVVPLSEGMEFEVQVAPDAIDTVYVGQSARIRFPSFDRRSTPELNGTISTISPDSVSDPTTGRTFYRVDVELSQDELTRLNGAELISGMPVEAFFQAGNRSVLSFLVKPLADQLAHAFREG